SPQAAGPAYRPADPPYAHPRQGREDVTNASVADVGRRLRRTLAVLRRGKRELRRQRARRVGVRARLGHEQRGAVVLQLLDALADVCERPVATALGGAVEVDPRIPAPGELLDARHVDDAVVQEALQRRHVAREEAAIGAHAVAG